MSTRGPVVGVLSTWFGGRYFGGLLGGITSALTPLGGRLVAIQTLDAGIYGADFAAAPPFRHRVAWDHVDGFITFLNGAHPDYLREAQAAGRPVVVISDTPAGLDCPIIGPDNHSGTTAAVTHLVEHGHTRIAFVGDVRQADVAERFAAYRAALRAHGLEPDDALVYDTGDMQVSGGTRAGQAMLAAGLRSTAVVAATDTNALGVMQVLGAAGCDLPADQAVIAFDDLPDSAWMVPSLSGWSWRCCAARPWRPATTA
jgi:DNA-binding LacI/PurR family transcriptional regulator